MKFVLTFPGRDSSGRALAQALRAVAVVIDDPSLFFDDPLDESGFDRNGQVFARDVPEMAIPHSGATVARWTVTLTERS